MEFCGGSDEAGHAHLRSLIEEVLARREEKRTKIISRADENTARVEVGLACIQENRVR